MKNLLISDCNFTPKAKLRIKRLLEKEFEGVRPVFLLFDRDDLAAYIWQDGSFLKRVIRRTAARVKRVLYRLLPDVEYVELRDIRQLFKDAGGGTVVIPFFDRADAIASVASEYLHDLPGENKLFIFNDKQELSEVDFTKPVLNYLEYHVAWHCNLKCKGCGHHSNLFRRPRMGDLQQYVSDMERLSALFRNISQVCLLGGEPLLNKELPAFIRETKRIFPDCSLDVVTNGLLIPKLDESVFQAMREADARFSITFYPPVADIKEKLIRICEKEGVQYSISPPVRQFYRQKHRWRYFDPNESFRHCQFRFCHSLSEGHIAVCPDPVVEEQSREYLPTRLRVSNSDTIDLYSPEIKSGYDILDRFHCAIPFCRYCDSIGYEAFQWEGHYPEFIDWK